MSRRNKLIEPTEQANETRNHPTTTSFDHQTAREQIDAGVAFSALVASLR
jgi:hypothetical protein